MPEFIRFGRDRLSSERSTEYTQNLDRTRNGTALYSAAAMLLSTKAAMVYLVFRDVLDFNRYL